MHQDIVGIILLPSRPGPQHLKSMQTLPWTTGSLLRHDRGYAHNPKVTLLPFLLHGLSAHAATPTPSVHNFRLVGQMFSFPCIQAGSFW
jgi:hypothetical protein